MLSCQKVLQAWVSDKSRLTFVVVDVGVILTINRKAYVRLVDMVKHPVCASINGAKEIVPWVANKSSSE